MADGYEADRTEAYFSGKLKPAPRPRRLKPRENEKKAQDERSPKENEKAEKA